MKLVDLGVLIILVLAFSSLIIFTERPSGNIVGHASIPVPNGIVLSATTIEAGTASIDITMTNLEDTPYALYRYIYVNDIEQADRVNNEFTESTEMYTLLVDPQYPSATGTLSTADLLPGVYEVGLTAYHYDFDLGDWFIDDYYYYFAELTVSASCVDGETRCVDGNTKEECIGEVWTFSEACEFACIDNDCTVCDPDTESCVDEQTYGYCSSEGQLTTSACWFCYERNADEIYCIGEPPTP